MQTTSAARQHNTQEVSISIVSQAPNVEAISFFHSPAPKRPFNTPFTRSPIEHCRIIVERLKEYHPRPYYCPSFQIGFFLAALGGIVTAMIVLKSILEKLHQQAVTTLAAHQARYNQLLYIPIQPHQPCYLAIPFDDWSGFCWPKGVENKGWFESCVDELMATCHDNQHYSRLIGVTQAGEVCLTIVGLTALVLCVLAVRKMYWAYQNNQLPLRKQLPEKEVEIVDKSAMLLNIKLNNSTTCRDVRQLFQQKATQLAAQGQLADESTNELMDESTARSYNPSY